ncbi:MAG TPA: hypothetical protein VFM35_00400 [Candidatus Binatia bacterium]|nr:hypothetical protein [Candidatus Binatia bacterium]
MSRRRLIISFTALSILYIVFWVGFVVLVSLDSSRNNWLVEREADPDVAPVAHVSQGDWVAKIARQDFASKSQAERIAIADQHFEKIKDLAAEQGYDVKALQQWYEHTAADFERYPVRTFVFAQGTHTYYRDLRNSGFPKSNFWAVFAAAFFSRETMLVALVGLLLVSILVLLVVGVFVAVSSRRLQVKWRALVIALIIVLVGEGWFMKSAEKHPVSLGLYKFDDASSYISVQGTWTSDTKLAAPLQSTKLDCWRQWNHCIEATAQILNGRLVVGTTYWEIKDWQANELTFHDRDSSLCKIESLRVDRKSKIVTYTTAPKQPKPDSCRGFEDAPIVSHLVGLQPSVQMKNEAANTPSGKRPATGVH